MSELLLQWLNTDLGLSRKVHKEYERLFDDGCLYVEILQKYNVLEPFQLNQQVILKSVPQRSDLAGKIGTVNSFEKGRFGVRCKIQVGDEEVECKSENVTYVRFFFQN